MSLDNDNDNEGDGDDDSADDARADPHGETSVLREVIPPALDGERVDRLVSLMTGASRSDAAKLVAAGGATLDGAVERSGKLRVRAGQTMSIDRACLPMVALPHPDPAVEVRIVHADEHVVVIDKPAGLVVHPGAGNPAGTLVNGLLARFPQIVGVGEPHRPGIVHRLDAGTSGLLVVALTREAYAGLTTSLAAHEVERTYRTLVWGHPAHAVGVVDGPIGRDPRDPLRMAVVVDGKHARTHYRVEATYGRPAEVAELECRLETGRTHQIRVHLAAIGHPVVGDATYGGARSPLVVRRPFLHAAALAFEHPVIRATLRFESPLPEDLQTVLSDLAAPL